MSGSANPAQPQPADEAPVVLVTGGGRGIGAAIVEACLHSGYAVCFTYTRDTRAATDLVERLDPAGHRLRAVQADVTDQPAMTAAFAAAEALGRLTAVVNNAGVTGTISAFADISAEETRRVVDVNLVAPVLICRTAVRRWRADPTGRSIVNISSIAATLGAPNEYIPYAATKAAVETLTIGLAKELGPIGIRVNAVSPGSTETTIHAAAGEPDRLARVTPNIPLRRPARPAEVADAVTWLISDRAGYVTGAVLRVSGGL